ncbi:MAG: InlB B-repeat-containing protein [Akkermansia sp.]|nr:InlB B-repeat-containing protein [Akkermansia sp.]
MNVGYNNTGNLSVEAWLGAQTFTTPAQTNKVTIVYNANGGSGAPSSQTATSSGGSDRFQVTLSSKEPTRSGYTFLGWSTSSTASAPSYYAGGRYYFTGSASGTTYTLYAVWSKNATYYAKIVYNADGGTGAPSSQTVSGSSSEVSVTLRTTEPKKSGFEFQGWSLYPGSATPSYYPGETYTFQGSTGTTTTTLYAVWMEVEYWVRISFITDHGESVTRTYFDPDSKVPVTMPTLSSDIPGLEFQGWATEVPASTVVYEPGKTYDFTGGAFEFESYELYAVWVARYLVTLHFDANGGEGAPASQTFTGQAAEVSCTLPSEVPTKADHTFAGWSCEGNTYDMGKTYTFKGAPFVSAEYTLVAVWTQGVQVGAVNIGGRNYVPYVCHGGRWMRATPRVF